jgi:hypothetical protein
MDDLSTTNPVSGDAAQELPAIEDVILALETASVTGNIDKHVAMHAAAMMKELQATRNGEAIVQQIVSRKAEIEQLEEEKAAMIEQDNEQKREIRRLNNGWNNAEKLARKNKKAKDAAVAALAEKESKGGQSHWRKS